MEDILVNMNRKESEACVDAVITSYNQKTMILEAVESLLNQTLLLQKIVIVDDGSTDEESLCVLKKIEKDANMCIPITIMYQENRGVSAARNVGIRNTESPMVLVLDGDDRIEDTYVECVVQLLNENPSMVAASSWMKTFGVLDAIVRPIGGNIVSFLSRNCCPATHILCREVFEKCGGYDETMKSGFEDWDFFLNMLEVMPNSIIGIVEKPLIQYRTNPASSNIKSMNKRIELMRYIIEKHINSYRDNITDALLEIEKISDTRLFQLEEEIIYSITNNQNMSQQAKLFIKNPSYGDGGMASAVQIVSNFKNELL